MKTWMTAGALGACLLVAACADPDAEQRTYANSDLELSPSYRAAEVCSCIFVMGQDEDFCNRWTVANPNVSTFRVDHEKKTVESSAFMMWGARAKFVDEKTGCVFED
ncbi:MAG TPA: hypothetical protein VK013_17630 [Myxococcaceae bacterium]|nr:hypothetical protein [Myxococcaceae bacterium]